MPRIEPPVSPLTEPFWDATREQRLLVQWCQACDAGIYWPRAACPRCLTDDSVRWRESTGRGTVYAASVLHQPGNPMMADRVPYVLALVDLDEGIRMATNVVGCEPADVAVGMAVRVDWEALSDGRHLPVFTPAG
jgi:uncharacterized OB-fold protein